MAGKSHKSLSIRRTTIDRIDQFAEATGAVRASNPEFIDRAVEFYIDHRHKLREREIAEVGAQALWWILIEVIPEIGDALKQDRRSGIAEGLGAPSLEERLVMALRGIMKSALESKKRVE